MRTEADVPSDHQEHIKWVSAFVVQDCPDATLVGRLVNMEEGHMTLGRSEDGVSRREPGALWLADDKVSFVHAVLRQVGDALVVKEPGSTNGTYLQGQDIRCLPGSEATWDPGQVLRLGATRLRGIDGSSSEARSHRSLEKRSSRDALTGVWNRRRFDEALERDRSAAARSERSLSLCLIDVDHFKRVNDTHGHGVGDRVLQELSRRMVDRLRASDLFARIGGEEFAALLQDTDEAQALQVAEDLRSLIARSEFEMEDLRLDITASIGVATLRKNETASSLLKRADEALYRAKNHGRDQVRS